MNINARGIMAIVLMLIAVISIIICTVSLVGYGALEEARISRCANNLHQLWKMQEMYNERCRNEQHIENRETGAQYWLAIASAIPQLVEKDELCMLLCPSGDSNIRKGMCDYTGPSCKINLVATNDPIGMCDNPKHGKYVVILQKSGIVSIVTRDDMLYKEAKQKTKY